MFPERQYQNGVPFALKLCTEFQETLLNKRVSTFFAIASNSLFLKEKVWPITTHFYEKYIKINCFKTIEA